MTTFLVGDASEGEPGFTKLLPIVGLPAPKTYTVFNPVLGDTIEVGEDECLFDVSEQCGDGYCDGCELPHEICACNDVYAPRLTGDWYDFEWTEDGSMRHWLGWILLASIVVEFAIVYGIVRLTGWLG